MFILDLVYIWEAGECDLTDSIKTWLESLGLGKYADSFIFHDIDLSILADLNNDDLKELGVSIGNRIRLREAIKGAAPQTPAMAKQVTTAFAPIQQSQSHPSAAPTVNSSDAERRPLTVMFCDLADSTALSTQLDPEDLQDVIRSYQETCTEILNDYGGYVAKYMGDGILVYFGYPKSLERNAESAVRSGLGIVDAMGILNKNLGDRLGIDITVRIGIATGMVMVGEVIGEGMAQERTVVGEAPNIAARLQDLAERNGIVIGSLTRELVGDVVIYEDMGNRELKGITGLVRTWGVVGLRDDDIEMEQDKNNIGSTELIGRDEETGLLRRAWQSVQEEGRGQVVSINGEAGIGKSVLVDGLRSETRDKGLPQLVMRCSPYHANSAFYPVIEYFKRMAAWQGEDSMEERLTKLETALEGFELPVRESVPLIAALMSLPLPEDRYPPLSLSPQKQKQQIQDLAIAMILEVAERQPLLQVWEDLHWADPSTLELIGVQIDQAPTASLLMLLTARPDFVPPWPARSHITPITLNRLESQHAVALVSYIADHKSLPNEVVDHIVNKADGVPLYVEELTKTILASDILRDTGERLELTGPLSSLSIPDTLQESLMARLDRLPQVRELAQLGSVLGREFAYEMISGLSAADDSILQDGLEQLVNAELLYQRGRPPRARYIFKHALVQDAAYGSLLRRNREQHHLQVAQLMETSFPDIIETHPELIAHHYCEAGESDNAIEYLQKAGTRSLAMSANIETVAHLSKALEILEALPKGRARDKRELKLRVILGPALIASTGYASAEVEPAYRRALKLAQKVNDVEKEFSTLQGLSLFHFVRSDMNKSLQIAEQLVELAKSRKDPGPDLSAERAMGYTLMMIGELEKADQCMTKVILSYNYDLHASYAFRNGGSDFGVGAYCISVWSQQALGFIDKATDYQNCGFVLAQKLEHPISMALSYTAAAVLYLMRGDPETAREFAASGAELATEKGLAQYLYWTKVPLCSAVFELTGDAQMIVDMREAINSCRTIGAHLLNPYWLLLLGDACGKNGQAADGLIAIEEGLDQVARTGEILWQPELLRLKGHLLMLLDRRNAGESEVLYHQSIKIAQSQKAKGWEIRAATSLAQLWLDQGKLVDARNLLQPVHDWFTEGFDAADLIQARALLKKMH